MADAVSSESVLLPVISRVNDEAAAKLANTISDLQAAAEANADAAEKAEERAAAAENNLLSVMERAAKETARADDAQVQRNEYQLRANEAAAKLAKTVTDLNAAAETRVKAAERNLQIALERATVAESNLHTARRQGALEKARADAAEAQQSTDCIYAESVATNLAKNIVDLQTKVWQLEAKLQAVRQPEPDKLSTSATRSSLRGVVEQPLLWKSSTSPANASQHPVQQSEPRDLSASQPELREWSNSPAKASLQAVQQPELRESSASPVKTSIPPSTILAERSPQAVQQPELRKSSTPPAKESLQAGQQSEPRKSSVSPAKASLQPSASPAKESLQAVQQFEHRKSSTSPSPSAVSSSPGPPPIPVSPRDSGDESSSRQRIFKHIYDPRHPANDPVKFPEVSDCREALETSIYEYLTTEHPDTLINPRFRVSSMRSFLDRSVFYRYHKSGRYLPKPRAELPACAFRKRRSEFAFEEVPQAKRSRRIPLETPCDDNESSKLTERTISSPAPNSTPALQKPASSSKSSAEASTKNDGSGEPVRKIKLIFAGSK
ncbi:hypothetical protein HDU89_008516 [Geranomyces variabilis]|nr:hypothetical protein HDU89_008516 [Geranomyces variabilis]